MHLAPACTFWLAVGMFIVEWPSMQANQALLLMARRPLLYLTGEQALATGPSCREGTAASPLCSNLHPIVALTAVQEH